MIKIGIIGKGFVGNAVHYGFSKASGYDAEIRIFDKNKTKSTHSLSETINNSDFVFVSVPTPSYKDGSINLNILEECIASINKVINKSEPIILIRSTVIPGTTKDLSEKFKDLNLVFNPEFLREKSANEDFVSQSRYIIGGEPKNTSKVAELYKKRFGKEIVVIETDFQTAELIKYMCNNFFAAKVSFMNEMKLICDSVGADWNDALKGFISDERVGNSHNDVPGHDGKLGFGGSCFPKDIQAMLHFAGTKNLDLPVVQGAWETNLNVRPEKDWEKLKGRAITLD